jgi:hypothetical protein
MQQDKHDNVSMQETYDKLKAALNALDSELIDIEGNRLKPSQCYHLGIQPPHVLFNTNCPESLKEKIQAIMAKYLPPDESSPSQ